MPHTVTYAREGHKMGHKKATPQTDPLAAVIYLRVSTDDQALGPVAQENAIRQWAERHQVKIVSVHLDRGVSGATPVDERPGFMLALADLEGSRAGHLLVAKLDRVARNIVVHAIAEQLVNRLGAVITPADGAGVGDSPEAAMLRGILQVFAQYERAVIRARTASAMKVKKARGERAGRNTPYGFTDDGTGKLIPAPDEQAAVRLARELRDRGMTLRSIAAQLQANGYQSRGKCWDPKTVSRMVA